MEEKSLFFIVFMFDLLLKSFALWKAARKNQRLWFAYMLFINSAGILPIIYMFFFQKDKNKKTTEENPNDITYSNVEAEK